MYSRVEPKFCFLLKFFWREKSEIHAELILHKSCTETKKICYCEHFHIDLLCFFFFKQASFSLGFPQTQPFKKSTNIVQIYRYSVETKLQGNYLKSHTNLLNL